MKGFIVKQTRMSDLCIDATAIACCGPYKFWKTTNFKRYQELHIINTLLDFHVALYNVDLFLHSLSCICFLCHKYLVSALVQDGFAEQGSYVTIVLASSPPLSDEGNARTTFLPIFLVVQLI